MRIKYLLICSLLASAASVSSWAQPADPNDGDNIMNPMLRSTGAVSRAGTIKTLEGYVLLEGMNGSRRVARIGDPIFHQDRIITGNGSGVGITLSDGSRMTVGANSTAEMSNYQYDPNNNDGNVIVNLFRGTLRMVTGFIGKTNPERVKVITPTATIGIRGTDFIAEAN